MVVMVIVTVIVSVIAIEIVMHPIVIHLVEVPATQHRVAVMAWASAMADPTIGLIQMNMVSRQW